jgi:hypothetical protein
MTTANKTAEGFLPRVAVEIDDKTGNVLGVTCWTMEPCTRDTTQHDYLSLSEHTHLLAMAKAEAWEEAGELIMGDRWPHCERAALLMAADFAAKANSLRNGG